MKKRKIKLFASIASLALVVAVMGVGVWAASSQAAVVNSKVKFSATSVAATINLKVADAHTTDNDSADILAYAGTSSTYAAVAGTSTEFTGTSGATIRSFSLTDSTNTAEDTVYIELSDKDGDGFIACDSTFTYTFTITPGTGSASVFYKAGVEQPATDTHPKVIADFASGTTGAITDKNGDKWIAPETAISGSATVTVTFTVKGEWDATLNSNAGGYLPLATALSGDDLPTIWIDLGTSKFTVTAGGE